MTALLWLRLLEHAAAAFPFTQHHVLSFINLQATRRKVWLSCVNAANQRASQQKTSGNTCRQNEFRWGVMRLSWKCIICSSRHSCSLRLNSAIWPCKCGYIEGLRPPKFLPAKLFAFCVFFSVLATVRKQASSCAFALHHADPFLIEEQASSCALALHHADPFLLQVRNQKVADRSKSTASARNSPPCQSF